MGITPTHGITLQMMRGLLLPIALLLSIATAKTVSAALSFATVVSGAVDHMHPESNITPSSWLRGTRYSRRVTIGLDGITGAPVASGFSRKLFHKNRPSGSSRRLIRIFMEQPGIGLREG